MKKFTSQLAFSILFSCCLFAQTDIKIKDTSNNTILKINDEGIAGSITLNPLTSIESSLNKLYAIGTDLYWNGSLLGTVSSAAGWTDAGASIYNTNLADYVGVGTNTPNAKLHLKGDNFPSTFMILESDATKDAGFRILENGVVKWHIFNDGTSQNLNIRNTAYNPLFILNQATGNIGIGTDNPLSKLSVGNNGSSNYEIYSETSLSDGVAVYGLASSSGTSTNYGGYFKSNGSNGTGVSGYATNSGDVLNYGGNFRADGVQGQGVHAEVSGNFARAIAGYATGTFGRGVYGVASNNGSTSNYGGYFEAYADNGRGVYAEAPITSFAFAGYFQGNVYISNTLTSNTINASVKNFKIDHPLDPENKYLLHTSVESSDMMDIYNGNVTTDGNGLANIELPEWFEALNKDFRYQLTPIGEFAQAIISEKIRNNQFSIKTDKPNIEVSWQVTGIRRDAFANANRTQVEELKESKHRGKYLNPEAFNKDESEGINYKENKNLR